MATKGIYIASGIAIAVAMLGFAGYKSMESRKSNDDQQLLVTGSGGELATNSGNPVDQALPSGNSIGDGNMGGGPGNQPDTGSAMNGFRRGGSPGSNPDIDIQTNPNRGSGGMGRNSGQGSNGQTRVNPVNPNRGTNPGGGNPGSTPGGSNPGGAPRGEMDFFGTGVMILTDAKVQSELRLSAPQKAAIKQVMEPPKIDNSNGDMGAQVQNYMSRASEQGSKVKAILDDNQEKRYMQLVHQVMGPVMMMNGTAKDKFSISEEETKKIGAVMQTFSAEFQKSMSGGQMPNMEAIAKVKGEMDKKIIASLDADSQGKWKAATGAPFTFSTPLGMGGMMGGMGGRGMGGRGGAPGGGGRRPGGN